MLNDIDFILRSLPEARYASPRHAGHPLLEAMGRIRAWEEELAIDAMPQVPWISKASAGRGATWANVFWIAAFDPAETTSAQEGRYVTTMFAADGSALVLGVVWGTQKVRRERGRDATDFLLARRAAGAALLADHLHDDHFELDRDVDLAAGTPLARDYERSCLAWRRWKVGALPTRDEFAARFRELLVGLRSTIEASI